MVRVLASTLMVSLVCPTSSLSICETVPLTVSSTFFTTVLRNPLASPVECKCRAKIRENEGAGSVRIRRGSGLGLSIQYIDFGVLDHRAALILNRTFQT